MAVLLLAVGGLAVAQRPTSSSESVLRLEEAPAAVQATFRKVASGSPASRVERHSEAGITEYEIDFGKDEAHASVKVSEGGDVVELESPVREVDLPAGALAALRNAYPNGTIAHAEAVQLFYYDVEVKRDGKVREVRVYSTGAIEELDEEGEDGDDENPDEGNGD